VTCRMATLFLSLGVLTAALPLLAEEEFPHSFEVTTTERMKFAPGGTIRLNGSYGYLSVDGWDEPQVEITVIKSTDRFFEPRQQEEAKQRLDLIHVTTEHTSETELSITTTRPARHNTWAHLLPRTTTEGVTVDLQIHVPRDSRLNIRHDMGYVWVSDVTGEIDAASHTGDMIVMLPDPGPYSIDAKTHLGSITSDFTGSGIKQFVTGTKFIRTGEGPARRIHLRMGRGSITVKKSPPPEFASKN
jgi:hypothetical protein